MALAQQALTVTQIIGDRLDLGIGLSRQPVVEGMWGQSFERPVGHMRDYLSVLVPLLSEGKVSHTGELVTGRGEIGVHGPRPPVYVAALGEQMLRIAGRLADGTVTWMTGPTTIETLTAPTITSAARSAGRPEPQIIAAAPVCVTEDVDTARKRAAAEFVIYGQLPSYRAMLDREDLPGPADLAIIGNQDEVEAGLQRYIDAGATQVVVAPFGTPDQITTTRNAIAELAG
jgi:F420-dependent oxidoreductase-like protein